MEAGVVGAGHHPVGELVGGGRVASAWTRSDVEHDRHVEPCARPKARASDVAASAVADRKLLSSFMAWPWPGAGPTWNTFPAMASSRSRWAVEGLHRAGEHERDRSAPRSGDAARDGPVDVGDAGRRPVPRGLGRSDRADGRQVDHGRRPPMAQCRRWPRPLARRTRPSGRLSSTVSARPPPARRPRPPLAPGGQAVRACRRRRSTPASKPAAARFAAMGPPMLPRPTKPTHGRRHGDGSGVMPSASSTWRARRNASTPAGTPA